MITGLDIRRYRRRLGWNQTRFAERLGVSQSALSLIESGRIPVSEDHISKLKRGFSGPKISPPFREFLRDLGREQAEGHAALTTPYGKYLILPVWRWESGFDLSSAPAPEQAVDLVAVRATKEQSIAFAMSKASAYWSEGEILVFECCKPAEVDNADICLLQVRPPRARSTRTMIAIARIVPGRGGRALQFEPLSPPAPVFVPKDDLLNSLLRTVYRGRRLNK